jgi:hypothetical protein
MHYSLHCSQSLSRCERSLVPIPPPLDAYLVKRDRMATEEITALRDTIPCPLERIYRTYAGRAGVPNTHPINLKKRLFPLDIHDYLTVVILRVSQDF